MMDNQEFNVAGDLSISGDLTIGNKVVTIQNIYHDKVLPIPRMAPLPPAVFIGQEELVFELTAALEAPPAAYQESSEVLILKGMGGIGKTAVAALLAQDPLLKDRYVDGTLWAELGPEPDVMTWLATWGNQLGLDLASYPSAEARSRALSSLIQGKQMLIILDNVWSVEAAALFMLGTSHSRTLVTTRDNRVANELRHRGRPFQVNPLAPEDGVRLLQRLAPEAVAENPAGAHKLAQHLAGIPLALNITGQTLANEWQMGLRIGEALQQVFQEQLLDNPQNSLRATLNLSYDHLEPNAQKLFRILGIFGGAPRTFTLDVVAELMELDKRAVQKMASVLVNQQVLEVTETGRLRLNSMVAEFALGLLQKEPTFPEVKRAHAQYYLRLASQTAEENWDVLEPELEQIRSSFAYFVAEKKLALATQYLRVMNGLLTRRGLWGDLQKWTQAALHLAQQVKDRPLIGVLYGNLAAVYHKQEQLEKALEAYEQSYQILAEAKINPAEMAVILSNMGAIYAHLDLFEEALDSYDRSQALLEETEDWVGLGWILNNIGALYGRQGDWEKALAHHIISYNLYRELQDNLGLAITFNHMGAIYDHQNITDEALDNYQQARDLFVAAGDVVGEALTLYNMGMIYETQQQYDLAIQCLARVVEIDQLLADPELPNDLEILRRLQEVRQTL